MADEPTYTPGRVVWHDLLTTDLERSRAFYAGLLGWRVEPTELGDVTYHRLHVGDVPIGGVLPVSALAGHELSPRWLAYVSVEDVDAVAAAAREADGTVLIPPRDTPPVGRMCLLQDPDGAIIAAWRNAAGDPPVDLPPVGTFCWDQLDCPDPARAASFYEQTLGWSRRAFEGDDQMLILQREGQDAAGVRTLADADTAIAWRPYVLVEDLETARAAATELGGDVLVEQIVVPGIGTFCVIADDLGARLALFQAPGADAADGD